MLRLGLLLTILVRGASGECDPRAAQVGSGAYCEGFTGGWGLGVSKAGGGCLSTEHAGQACGCQCECTQNFILGGCMNFKCVSGLDYDKQFCYSTTSQCQPCLAGFERVGCGCSADWTECTGGSCSACAGGTFGTGAGACVGCSACAPGQYMQRACTAGSDTVCVACPAGSYCPTPAVLQPTACPAGSYCPGGSTAPTQCVASNAERCAVPGLSAPVRACEAGMRLTTANTCVPCDAGTFNAEVTAETRLYCAACPAGLYQGSTGRTSCAACAAGSEMRLQTGATGCWPCGGGKYSAADGTVQCSACGEGTQSAAGSTACLRCGAGRFANAGRTACPPCAVGSYGIDGIACAACPAGQSTFTTVTYYAGSVPFVLRTATSGASSASACASCSQGSYLHPNRTDFVGGETNICLPCPDGYYCAGGGAAPAACETLIKPNTYEAQRCDATRAQLLKECAACGATQFEAQPCEGGLPRICVACDVCEPPGAITFERYTAAACTATANAKCVACNASAGDTQRGGRCNPCPPGTAGALCEPCAAGTWSAGAGAACQPCAAGFTSGGGAGGCTVSCSGAGQYAPDGRTCVSLSTAQQQTVATDPDAPGGFGALAPLPPLLGPSGFLGAWSPPGLRGQLVVVAGESWWVAGNTELPPDVAYAPPAGVWQDGTECIFGEITSLTLGDGGMALLTEAGGLLREVELSPGGFLPSIRVAALAQSTLKSAVDAHYVAETDTFLVLDQAACGLFAVRVGSVRQDTLQGLPLLAPSAVTGLGDQWVLVLDGGCIFSRSAAVGPGPRALTLACGSRDDRKQTLESAAVGQAFAPSEVSLRYAVDITVAGGRCWILVVFPQRAAVLVWDFQVDAPSVIVAGALPAQPLRFASLTSSGDESLYISFGDGSITRLDWQGGCQCDPGLFCMQGRHCVQAPAGSFTEGWSTAASLCPAGYGGRVAGARSASEGCLRCPRGYTTLARGAPQCVRACPAGMAYNQQTGGCLAGCNATLGLYLDTARGACAQCRLGSGAVEGVAGAESCVLCDFGWYGRTPGVCARCPEGSSTFDHGATRCMPVEPSEWDDGSPLPRALPPLAGATGIALTGGGDLYAGAGAVLWRAGASAWMLEADWSALALHGAGPSARGYFGLIQADVDSATLYTAAIGGSCVYALRLNATAGGLLDGGARVPLAGDCGRASHRGTGMLGVIHATALGEMEGHTSVLFVSSTSPADEGGCTAIFAVSTHDGAVQPLASGDPTQFPSIFIAVCFAEPLVLATQRGAGTLLVGWGQSVFASQAMGPQRKMTSAFFISQLLLQLDERVVGLAAQPGWPLLALTADGALHVFSAAAFAGEGQGVRMQTAGGAAVASAGRRAWVLPQAGVALGNLSQNCAGGFIRVAREGQQLPLCMQAGIGHTVTPDSEVRACPAGTSAASAGGGCAPCLDGAVAPGEGATVCSPCGSGLAATADGTGCVVACPQGSYLGRARQCVACGSGFTSSPAGQTTAAACRPCPAGTYANASTGGLCAQCPAGFSSLAQSERCVVMCALGECAPDGARCESLTHNFEVLSQISMGTNMVALSVDEGGGVFYTDGTVVHYYLDDCVPEQAAVCVKRGASLLPSSYAVDQPLTGYTFSALAISNVRRATPSTPSCAQRRTLYLASLTYNSVYSLDVCSLSATGAVDVDATLQLVVTKRGLTLVAGVPSAGPGFSDGDFSLARFNQPLELALTADGALLYVSDFYNHRVRKLDVAARVASTALGGEGLPCASFGAAACGSGGGTCAAPACASVQLPAGLGLSRDGRDLYVSMHGQHAVGVLENAATPAQATFRRVCSYSQYNVMVGSVPMCDLGAARSKGCPLFRPFDVVSVGTDLYVGVTQGLTHIDLDSGTCEQIAGQFFKASAGNTDGVGPTTEAGATGMALISSVNVPFRLALSAGTGILYFADLANGAVRRILVQARCACPAGLAFVPGANSCYDASPRTTQGALPPCRCGFYALPGDRTCFRSCSDAAASYGSSAAPCLSQQACPSSASAPVQASGGAGWPFSRVLGSPQPVSAILSDWYGQGQDDAAPTWDAIFAQRSPVTYRMGATAGREPSGREFVALTFLGDCWAVESDPALQPRRVLPGLWYPCTASCECPLNVGAFGLDAASDGASWYKARWEAVNGGGRTIAQGRTAGKAWGGCPATPEPATAFTLQDLVRGTAPPTTAVQLWSRFLLGGGGQIEHLQQSPPTAMGGLSPSAANRACVASGGGGRCYAGWPAHYACPPGYMWVGPGARGGQEFCEGVAPGSQVACLSCLPGQYAPAAGGYQCLQCPTGFYSLGSGASVCLPCPNGTYADAAGASACKACAAAATTYRTGAWAMEQCVSCPSGTGNCGGCGPGEYQLKAGQIICLLAPAGSYTSAPQSANYTRCPPGQFQPNAGRSSCERCPSGQYTPAGVTGATSCRACAASACPLVVDNVCGGGCGLNRYWDALAHGCADCPAKTMNPSDRCALGVEACVGLDSSQPPPLNRYIVGGGAFAYCPDGTHADVALAFASCSKCGAGYFSRNTESVVGCTKCPNGTYSTNASGSAGCSPCAAGKHSSQSGAAACAPCGGGTFAPGEGFGDCLRCPAGAWAGGGGLTACAACAAGMFSNASGSTACEFPCDAAADLYVGAGGTACSVCAGGIANAAEGDCDPCGLGRYAGRINGQRQCLPCPAGTANLDQPFCANGTACCARCPQSNQFAAASGAQCVEALAGAMPSDDGTGQVQCPAGTFRSLGMPRCAPCPPGAIASAPGAQACALCRAGWISAVEGATACAPCPSHQVSLSEGGTACGHLCPAGTEGAQGQACVPCPANFFSTAGVCVPCGDGQVSAGGGSTCTPCPQWTFYNHSSRGCSPCGAGSYMSSPSAGACEPCQPGTFLAMEGGTSAGNCTPCAAGLVSLYGGQPACAQCPPGSVGVRGILCRACPAGTFRNGTLTNCTPCDAGTYAPAGGSANCTPCGAGRFSNGTGRLACQPCPAGTFAPAGSTTTCAPCTLELGFADRGGLASCLPRRARCEPGFFLVLSGSPSADNQCAPCTPCAGDQLAAYQQPGGTDSLLLRNATELQTSAQAMSEVCPGTTTAPLFQCIPGAMPPGWYISYSSLSEPRAGASSGGGMGAVDPYAQTQCQTLTAAQRALAAYRVGPSVLSCFVGCLYGVSPAGVAAYRSKWQSFDSRGQACCENPEANLFYTQMLESAAQVCLPCPSAPCNRTGSYRPLVAEASRCGPPCALPGQEWAAACAANPDGCTEACGGLPANAFFTTGSATTGASGGCRWQCAPGFHLSQGGGGCDPCDLGDNATAIAAFCGGTHMAMRPPSQCFATDTRAELCVACARVPFSRQPRWDPVTAQCVYPCLPGYFFYNGSCLACDATDALVGTCAAGTYLEVDVCYAFQRAPECRPCNFSGEPFSALTTSFTTSGGLSPLGCRAICKTGFHTVDGRTGAYLEGGDGPNATDLRCVRCQPTDGRSCAAQHCFPGYWRVPSVPDGALGSCRRCLTSDQCAAGAYATACSGNETTDASCRQCQTLPPSDQRQYVPYAAQTGPNRNRLSTSSGDCPTACLNNHVQRAGDGACVPCESLLPSTCQPSPGQPTPCSFVYAHWNATPGLPWWDPSATPAWLNPRGQRAGICWACPFGTATTAGDADLCVILPGFSVVSRLPTARFPIPTLQEGLEVVFREPRPAGVAAGRRLLVTLPAASSSSTPAFYPFKALMRRSVRHSRALLGAEETLQRLSDTSSPVANLSETEPHAIIGACPFGSYKAEPGPGACFTCPAFSSTIDSASVTAEQCLCQFGHTRRQQGGGCVPCPPDTRGPQNKLGGACVPCADDETTFGQRGQTACACRPGLRRLGAGVCAPCPPDHYCPQCSQDDNALMCGAVLECFAGSASPPGSHLPDNCTCGQGKTRLERPQARGDYYCSALPAGAIVSPLTGRVVCGPGWMAVGGGDVTECALCPRGHYAVEEAAGVALLDAYRQPTCVPCAAGKYSGSRAAVGAQCCLSCPAQQTTAAPGATSVLNCTCPAGMGKLEEAGGVCVGCSASQFRDVETGQCVDCPANAVALAGATSYANGCACAQGYSLSAGGVCLPCPQGTFSSVSSNAPCMPCPAGSTTLNAGSTSRRACGASPSLCLPGYVWRQGLGCFRG